MKMWNTVLLIALLVGCVATANADYDDYLWADSVEGWNGNIKNFGDELMTWETSWWLTGLPDCDMDGNGYAFDPGDNDYVAGWKMPPANDSFTVKFDTLIQNSPGDDVLVVGYSGPTYESSVQASSDGINFTELGTIGIGQPGYLHDFWFDLGGLTDAQYIRVERLSTASLSGGFVDAIGAVPEPTSAMLLILGGLFVVKGRVQSPRSKVQGPTGF
ncbi:MAG: PEP-CTERM sorting domain-containing protein [Phycisphaerae bacterium]|nr:PEP-CTERM sorting domain-containing protein [Phycisphaerae bacterium]